MKEFIITWFILFGTIFAQDCNEMYEKYLEHCKVDTIAVWESVDYYENTDGFYIEGSSQRNAFAKSLYGLRQCMLRDGIDADKYIKVEFDYKKRNFYISYVVEWEGETPTIEGFKRFMDRIIKEGE